MWLRKILADMRPDDGAWVLSRPELEQVVVWMARSWKRVSRVTIMRSWAAADCVPPTWQRLFIASMPRVTTLVLDQLTDELMRLQGQIDRYIPSWDRLTAVKYVCVESDHPVCTNAVTAGDFHLGCDTGAEPESAPGYVDDVRSIRRVMRTLSGAFAKRAADSGKDPADVVVDAGITNADLVSRNKCDACALEFADDNALQSHVTKNNVCRQKLKHIYASKLVAAYREALIALAASKLPAGSAESSKSPPRSSNLKRPHVELSPPAPTSEADCDDAHSDVTSVDDCFDTLQELYLFFRDADLSIREVNRLLHIFRSPLFDLQAARSWRNAADVRRYGKEREPPDIVPWTMEEIKVFGPHGKVARLTLHVRNTELVSLAMCAELRFIFVTDVNGKAVKAYPCLFAEVGDYPELSRATGTMQATSHRPCSSCYVKEDNLARVDLRAPVRTVDKQRRIVHAIQTAATDTLAQQTEWGNVFLACVADILHALDFGVFGHSTSCLVEGKSKPEKREWEGRKKSYKKDTRSTVLRIPGGSSYFRSAANYAAFEHRAMMQVMPLIIADKMDGMKPKEREQREREVRAFRMYATFYKALVGVVKHTRASLAVVRQHAISMLFGRVHLQDGGRADRGFPRTVIRMKLAEDIPRRIVEEEVQRELAREVAVDACGGRQYTTALREAVRLQEYVLTRRSRVANPSDPEDGTLAPYRSTLGSDMNALTSCATRADLSLDRFWVSVVLCDAPKEKEEWYARCLCIFRAKQTDGTIARFAYVKYYEAAGVCGLTTCIQLTPGRVKTKYAVVEIECIKRVVLICKSFVNARVLLLNKFLLCE
ncbi:unnamed protein product [Closterium sp. Yama58-4]|nr:unnamed protein product [Closterium sp. Yama58-4]